jgi:hypothetical protein
MKVVVLGFWSLYLVLCALYFDVMTQKLDLEKTKYKVQSTKYKDQRPKTQDQRPKSFALETLPAAMSYQSIQSLKHFLWTDSFSPRPLFGGLTNERSARTEFSNTTSASGN